MKKSKKMQLFGYLMFFLTTVFIVTTSFITYEIVKRQSPQIISIALIITILEISAVLTVADVGISMGGIGSDVAIEASDIVLMTDDLSCLPKAINIAKKTLRTVKQNIVFALGIKIAVLVLSAFGITGMWLAVFADVGVAVLAILNSMRTLKVEK